MKKLLSFLCCVLLLCSPVLTSCSEQVGYQSSYDDAELMKQAFLENQPLYLSVAEEALSYGDSTFISTYDYFRPEGADAQATGLYVHDTEAGETRALDSGAVLQLFEICSVHSIAVKKEEDVMVCEFSIGGGKQYFNGIYYVSPDREVFLNNFSVPLETDGSGFSYSVENMNYYTEKWSENFYYYVAKTK